MHEYIEFEIWGEPILKPAQRGSNRWPSSSHRFIVQGSSRRQLAEISHRHAMQKPTGDARLTSAHQGACWWSRERFSGTPHHERQGAHTLSSIISRLRTILTLETWSSHTANDLTILAGRRTTLCRLFRQVRTVTQHTRRPQTDWSTSWPVTRSV
jgi:hypothetical protein